MKDICAAVPRCPACGANAYHCAPLAGPEGRPDAVACAKCGEDILATCHALSRRRGQGGLTLALLAMLALLALLLAKALLIG